MRSTKWGVGALFAMSALLAAAAASGPVGPAKAGAGSVGPSIVLDERIDCVPTSGPTRQGRPSGQLCTHGPDAQSAIPPVGPAVVALQAAELPLDTQLATAGTAGIACYGDGTTGPRVQAVYARASDQLDRYAETVPQILAHAAQVESEVAASAAETSGERHVRWVTDTSCNLSVLNIVLAADGDDDFISKTVVQMRAKGYEQGDRAYLMWMDATRYCGIGSIYTDDVAGSQNRNFFGPSWSRVDRACWGVAETHELGHNLGGVQRTAPNSNNAGHCTDEYDLMCYADPNGRNLNTVPNGPPIYTIVKCPDRAHDRRYDCNHDDYFNTNPALNSYLATHWNAADSPFLARTPSQGTRGLGAFHPVAPGRVHDGRNAGVGRIPGNGEQYVQVTGAFGIPPVGVSAVAVNVTVTGPVSSGYLTLYSIDEPQRPVVSNLNYTAGQTVANSVLITVPYDGKIAVYSSSGSPYVIVDVAGWYADASGYDATLGGYHPLTPTRVLDTRNVTLGGPAPLGTGGPIDLQVTGVAGIPAGASAVALNLTGLSATQTTWLTAWPSGLAQPLASNLNLNSAAPVANQVVAKLSAAGKLSIANANGTTHVIADVTGWYDDGGAFAASGYIYHAVSPVRITDTRPPVGNPLQGGVSRAVNLVGGISGIPSSGVAAVTANVTVTQPSAGGWLTAWPAGAGQPDASLLNFATGQTVPNFATLSVAAGQVNVAVNSGTAHFLVDVTGWFGPLPG